MPMKKVLSKKRYFKICVFYEKNLGLTVLRFPTAQSNRLF